jgi:CRP-like cAMP-binding protein
MGHSIDGKSLASLAGLVNMIDVMLTEIERHLHGLRPRKVLLEAGQSLFHLGDPVDVIHFVDAGTIQLTRHQCDGSELILQRAGPGSIVAEASVYSDVYHCDAVALGPARTRAYAKADLKERLRGNPTFSNAWASHLAQELQRARLHAEILSLKTVGERLNAWTVWKGTDLPQKGDWKNLANQLGVSPEALYREMAKRR